MGNEIEKDYQKIIELDQFPQPHVMLKDLLIKKLINECRLCSDSRFLDIGCGRGRILKMMADRGYTGVGVDIEDDCVDICKRRLNGTGIEISKDLGQIKETFDLVIMSSVLEHIKDDQAFLCNVNKLIKKNRYFLFTVPGDMRIYGKRDIAYGHYRRYEEQELRSKLDRSDFLIEKLWSYGINCVSKIYRMIINKDINRNLSDEIIDNTKRSALHSDGFDKIKKLYPIYSKLMFFYKIQLLFLDSKLFRANYAGLCRKR